MYCKISDICIKNDTIKNFQEKFTKINCIFRNYVI